jgi:hypothetical protein
MFKNEEKIMSNFNLQQHDDRFYFLKKNLTLVFDQFIIQFQLLILN